ncbi:Docking protein 1, partial [Fragariocoptes setiger]
MDDTQRIVKCGNLSIQSTGGLFKKWQRKYLVLYDGSKSGIRRLEMFDSEMKFKKQSPAKIISLVDCIRVVTCQRHKTYTFEVRTPEHMHFLAAQSYQDMNDWINCIRSVAFERPSVHHHQQLQQPVVAAATILSPLTNVNNNKLLAPFPSQQHRPSRDPLLQSLVANSNMQNHQDNLRYNNKSANQQQQQQSQQGNSSRLTNNLQPIAKAIGGGGSTQSTPMKPRQRQPSLMGTSKLQPPSDSPFLKPSSDSNNINDNDNGGTMTPTLRAQLVSTTSETTITEASNQQRQQHKETTSALTTVPALDEEEENLLYCSIEDNPSEHNYRVKVIETGLAIRCHLKCYKLSSTSTVSMQYDLLPPQQSNRQQSIVNNNATTTATATSTNNNESSSLIAKYTDVTSIHTSNNHSLESVTFYQLIVGPQELILLNDYSYPSQSQAVAAGLWSWPYRCIRRYGFDKEDCFMFEAGRKCTSGPGQFIVQTPKAKNIYQDIVKLVNAIAKASQNGQNVNPATQSLPSLMSSLSSPNVTSTNLNISDDSNSNSNSNSNNNSSNSKEQILRNDIKTTKQRQQPLSSALELSVSSPSLPIHRHQSPNSSLASPDDYRPIVIRATQIPIVWSPSEGIISRSPDVTHKIELSSKPRDTDSSTPSTTPPKPTTTTLECTNEKFLSNNSNNTSSVDKSQEPNIASATTDEEPHLKSISNLDRLLASNNNQRYSESSVEETDEDMCIDVPGMINGKPIISEDGSNFGLVVLTDEGQMHNNNNNSSNNHSIRSISSSQSASLHSDETDESGYEYEDSFNRVVAGTPELQRSKQQLVSSISRRQVAAKHTVTTNSHPKTDPWKKDTAQRPHLRPNKDIPQQQFQRGNNNHDRLVSLRQPQKQASSAVSSFSSSGSDSTGREISPRSHDGGSLSSSASSSMIEDFEANLIREVYSSCAKIRASFAVTVDTNDDDDNYSDTDGGGNDSGLSMGNHKSGIPQSKLNSTPKQQQQLQQQQQRYQHKRFTELSQALSLSPPPLPPPRNDNAGWIVPERNFSVSPIRSPSQDHSIVMKGEDDNLGDNLERNGSQLPQVRLFRRNNLNTIPEIDTNQVSNNTLESKAATKSSRRGRSEESSDLSEDTSEIASDPEEYGYAKVSVNRQLNNRTMNNNSDSPRAIQRVTNNRATAPATTNGNSAIQQRIDNKSLSDDLKKDNNLSTLCNAVTPTPRPRPFLNNSNFSADTDDNDVDKLELDESERPISLSSAGRFLRSIAKAKADQDSCQSLPMISDRLDINHSRRDSQFINSSHVKADANTPSVSMPPRHYLINNVQYAFIENCLTKISHNSQHSMEEQQKHRIGSNGNTNGNSNSHNNNKFSQSEVSGSSHAKISCL